MITVRYPDPLPPVELEALIARAQAGDVAARNRVVSTNMRLVVSRARRLARVSGRDDLVDDFVQAGAIGSEGEPTGLVRAIALYDPCTGFTFATFARSWIDAAMLGVIAARASVAPLSRSELSRRIMIHRVAAKVADALRREPSAEEIHAAFLERHGYVPSLACVKRYVEATARGEPTRNGKVVRAGTHDNAFGDDGSVRADDALADHEQQAALQKALAGLSATERRVIAGRFGLGDAEPETLREIGEELNLSRERIRLIEAGALRKLRKALGTDAAA